MNRIKGLLYGRGVSGYEPLKRDRRTRLDELETLLVQEVKKARDAMLAAGIVSPLPAMLLALKGIGPEFAGVIWSEELLR